MAHDRTIRVGTCGYGYFDPGEGWKQTYESKLQAYSEHFAVGELNRTFYSLPRVSTAERWRREARADFEFALKAWQALTHGWSSPTWNGHRDDVPEDRTDEVGSLQPTAFVRDAWAATLERARALQASILVVQTPPSFGCTEDHENNMRQLFDGVDREGIDVAWEPRGDWREHPDRIERICADLDLVHVVDLMREQPLDDHHVAYTRLHGLNEDRYEYDYSYADSELDELADRVRDLATDRERVYCLFNNVDMYDDARALDERVG